MNRATKHYLMWR